MVVVVVLRSGGRHYSVGALVPPDISRPSLLKKGKSGIITIVLSFNAEATRHLTNHVEPLLSVDSTDPSRRPDRTFTVV